MVVTLLAQAIDPGTWGKADQATMSRRKVVRARRGAGAAEPAQVSAAPEAAAGSNPFAGVSLAAAAPAANPFAGITLTPAAKVRPCAPKHDPMALQCL